MNENTAGLIKAAPRLLPPDETHRILVDAVVDYAIYMLDAEGRVATWNPGAVAIKGYTPDEIIGEHFSRFFTEEDLAAGTPGMILERARTEGRYAAEGWRVRKDGKRFWALAVIDAIRNDRGEITGFAKITRDMTERREAEESLRRSEQQFRLLVSGVSDYALYMLDPQGVVTNWNVGAQAIKGYRAEEVIGSHFSRFYTEEDRVSGLPTKALETARSTGRYEAEGWRIRKDGTRFWANAVIDAIRDDTGELVGFAKITRDVTDRMETQRRLEETREQLFQSQKMEAVGQLTGGVAHDFNNLLTVIIGGVDMARRKIGDPARVEQLLDAVSDAARRGASLTRQLLAFSRRQSLTPEPIALNRMLPGFSQLLDRSLGGGIDIAINVEDGVTVLADQRQLELALLNVGLNARDAMPDGGRITISATRRRMDQGAGGLNGDFIAIAMTDTGSGMPPHVRDRVFEPFFTTKEVGRGTGLGLSQAYGFAQQSGGAIELDSEVGRGTTVTFVLPETAATAVADTARTSEASRDLTGRRILVVEDDLPVARVACATLKDAGAEVIHVASVAAAGQALEEASVDLVFSDVVMPGGRSGFDLAREVRREHPDLPVLLATGYGGEAAIANSEFPVLAKPYSPEELRRAIAEAIC